MKMIQIKDREQSLIEKLCKVWRSSVSATHLFLSEAEIEMIAGYVPDALKGIFVLVIAVDEQEDKMDYIIRKIRKTEYPLLADFLYEAIFVPAGAEPPPKSIVASAELQVYIDHFGELKDDKGLVAELEGNVVGAVWVRIMNDYGHIDDETPSFGIALYKEYRGLGIGTKLLKAMLDFLKKSGYKRASLAVQKANYALKMYQDAGFEIVDENTEEYIMLKHL